MNRKLTLYMHLTYSCNVKIDANHWGAYSTARPILILSYIFKKIKRPECVELTCSACIFTQRQGAFSHIIMILLKRSYVI